MIRATLVALVCCLIPSWLYGQTTQFTVTTESAQIYMTPSTGSAVIGHVPQGTVFEVTRELGSWVRIPWPAGPDGSGYVHVSWGTVAHGVSADAARAAEAASPVTKPAGAPAMMSATRERATIAASPATSLNTQYIVAPTHRVGFGGRLAGSTLGYGGTARTWSRGHLGLQIDGSRYELTNAGGGGRVASMQVAPALLYSLKNHVGDYVWVRPYIGAGPALYHQTFSASPTTGSVSDNSFGFQSFGGGEFTFASVPRLAISADGGYRWARTAFAGFDLRGPIFSMSAHWYVR